MLGFSFRLAHRYLAYAYGGIFHPFYTVHNFTFDTVDCNKYAEELEMPPGGVIHMLGADTCYRPAAWCHIPPMVLSTFDSLCSLSFSKSVQPDPFTLSSLAAPFTADRMAQLLLLGSCMCMALTLLKTTGKWDILEALLAVMSGIVGKSLSLRGDSQYVVLYATWLLAIGFISIGYTNVLQSIFIVPTTQHSDRSFDEMIKQNYTFATNEYRFIRARSIIMSSQYLSGSGGGKKFKMLEMQNQLAERIIERKINSTSLSAYYSLVEEFREGQKKSFILQRKSLETFELCLPLTDGWQMVVGAEEFFNAPTWWHFGYVERGSLLAESLERFKQAGMISYFLQLYDYKARSWNAAFARSQQNTSDGPVALNEPFGLEWRVPVGDALTSEAFVIFLYGMAVAVGEFASEIAIKVSMGLFKVELVQPVQSM